MPPMLKLFPPLIACLSVASCGLTRGDPAVITPPPSLTQPCPAPVDLPQRALNDAEVEVLWGRDRSALRACASRHAALAEWPG